VDKGRDSTQSMREKDGNLAELTTGRKSEASPRVATIEYPSLKEI